MLSPTVGKEAAQHVIGRLLELLNGFLPNHSLTGLSACTAAGLTSAKPSSSHPVMSPAISLTERSNWAKRMAPRRCNAGWRST